MRLLFLFLLFFSVAGAGEIQQITSPKGLTAWLVYDDSSEVISMDFTFKGQGATTDPDGRRGSASLMSALMTQGAGELNSQAVQRQLNDLSVSLGFSVGKDNLHGNFSVLKKYLSPASDLLKQSLTSARFDKSDFTRMQKIMVSNAMQNEKDAAASAGNLLWEFAFADDSYALPAGGTIDTIKNIKLRDIKNSYKNLSRQDLSIGVAGNISAEELSLLLDDVFGDLPETPPVRDPLPPAHLANQGKIAVIEQAVPQSHIAFMQAGLPQDDDDFFTAYLLNHIIGGSVFSSLLGQEIRKKRGLVYSIYSHHTELERIPIIIGGAATNNDDAAETVRLIRQIWQDAAAGNFTQTQLDSARLYLLGSYAIGLTNTYSIANWLNYQQRKGRSPNYIAYRTERLNAITIADLRRVAKELLDANSLSFAIVGQPKGIDANNLQ